LRRAQDAGAHRLHPENRQTAASLLVFFSSGGAPAVLASAPETELPAGARGKRVLGFNWGIDPASPEQVHEAQSGMNHPPPRLDHDALCRFRHRTRRTIYRVFAKGHWTSDRYAGLTACPSRA
jgi:hypothetical protein